MNPTLYQRANCVLVALIVAVLFFGVGALWQKRRDAERPALRVTAPVSPRVWVYGRVEQF